MESIREAVSDFITSGGMAKYATVGGVHGVFFTDDGEFIPWSRLGYSRELGFFDRQAFDDEQATAVSADWSVHTVTADDGWQAVGIVDEGGHGYLVGERWQVVELLHALEAYLERGEASKPLPDTAEVWRTRVWLSIAEAVAEAKAAGVSISAEGIRRAAQRGALASARGETGRYRFERTAFRRWLKSRK